VENNQNGVYICILLQLVILAGIYVMLTTPVKVNLPVCMKNTTNIPIEIPIQKGLNKQSGIISSNEVSVNVLQ
jgi:hypothetical protein